MDERRHVGSRVEGGEKHHFHGPVQSDAGSKKYLQKPLSLVFREQSKSGGSEINS